MTERRLLIEELYDFEESMRRIPADVWAAVRGALPRFRVSRALGVVWVAVWLSRSSADAGGRAKVIVRVGRPSRLLFSERHQGTRGIPVRWHYALGGRLAARWEPRAR